MDPTQPFSITTLLDTYYPPTSSTLKPPALCNSHTLQRLQEAGDLQFSRTEDMEPGFLASVDHSPYLPTYLLPRYLDVSAEEANTSFLPTTS